MRVLLGLNPQIKGRRRAVPLDLRGWPDKFDLQPLHLPDHLVVGMLDL